MPRFIRIASAGVIVALTFQLMADSRQILKIAITGSGEITADGRPTTLEALIPIFRELAKKQTGSLVLPRSTEGRTASECGESIERHRRQ